ncbi:MAG: methyltransferase domain-containing protein, partial [Patescibacteria group bacterium]
MLARIRAKARGISHGPLLYYALNMGLIHDQREGVSLGGGGVRIRGYWDIDICHSSDLVMDLSKKPMPFREQSMKYAVCISVISYFPYDKASFLIKEIFRVLKKGGIVRFGAPDLHLLAKKYVEGDREFFFQKLPNGHDRF